MNLNKLFYNIAKKVKKFEFRFDYIENMGILSVPHKLCEFTIDNIVDVNEYINLYVDSEYYNISNEELEKLDVDNVADDIIRNIIDCYIDKIYEQISNVDKYIEDNDNYYLTIHYNNQFYDVIGKYIYDSDCFVYSDDGNIDELRRVFS